MSLVSDVANVADVADVALLGTGVAPLVAANRLLGQGHSVLLLNPDADFFLEDSELPLDPLWPLDRGVLNPARLSFSSPERALAELQPSFPGAVEHWSENMAAKGFHDPSAPHVRQRGRLWVNSLGNPERTFNWDLLEELYVQASDLGLNPQILEGLQAAKRFPGFSKGPGDIRGLYLPKFCDVDVTRFRMGLLEFVRERLGTSRVVCSATQIEPMPGGIRFHSQGAPRTARLREGMLVFWTPRLSQWILAQAKKYEVEPSRPKGVRLWEEWSLVSREPLDPKVIAMLADLAVWAETEGAPTDSLHRLAVLRAGPLVDLDEMSVPKGGTRWASAESFGLLSGLCHDFLKWERLSVRAMKPRAIFEWKGESHWQLSGSDPLLQVISSCDGPLVDVVRTARIACERLESQMTRQLEFGELK